MLNSYLIYKYFNKYHTLPQKNLKFACGSESGGFSFELLWSGKKRIPEIRYKITATDVHEMTHNTHGELDRW